MTQLVKHTPGPWKVHVASDETIETRIKAGTEILAHICDLGTFRIAEQEGNANLVAAAPAMYEALRELVRYLQDKALDNWAPVFKAACALKQAEGKL